MAGIRIVDLVCGNLPEDWRIDIRLEEGCADERGQMSDELHKTKLDRMPFVSMYFLLRYDDSQKFPWRLILKSTGRDYTGRRRKYVAQEEATEMDKLIQEATSN